MSTPESLRADERWEEAEERTRKTNQRRRARINSASAQPPEFICTICKAPDGDCEHEQ